MMWEVKHISKAVDECLSTAVTDREELFLRQVPGAQDLFELSGEQRIRVRPVLVVPDDFAECAVKRAVWREDQLEYLFNWAVGSVGLKVVVRIAPFVFAEPVTAAVLVIVPYMAWTGAVEIKDRVVETWRDM